MNLALPEGFSYQTSAPDAYGISLPGAEAFFSGRSYDSSRYDAFFESLGIHSSSICRIHQQHTAEVLVCEKAEDAGGRISDALITSNPDLTLLIKTADCIPVFFLDSAHRVVALTHAGWRGLESQIIPKTIRKMTDKYDVDPAQLSVAVGPCIRKCCYEVGPELKAKFKDSFQPYTNNEGSKGKLDLVDVLYKQLKMAGIAFMHVKDSKICTCCHKNRVFSVRGEPGTENRILSVLRLTQIK